MLPAAHGGPSESVVSVEVGSSRQPVVRPGIARGRIAASKAASCTRRAIRVSRHCSGEVGSSRQPVIRPGIAPGRAVATGIASCTRRAIRVSRQCRGWQLAPASCATRGSSRAGRGRRGCQLHTAGLPSQSSVARLAARAGQLCDPG